MEENRILRLMDITAAGSAQAAGEAVTKEKGKAKAKKRSLSNILMGIALAVGTMLLVYPKASDYWNSFTQSRSIMGYAEQVAQMSAAEYAKFISEAEEYNAKLAENGNEWHMTQGQKKVYESRLTFDSTGVMGYIDIPKISTKLPIYHGTSDAVLQTSIGHLAESSLPVGGKGSHCVLSGHRGLPSAKLFSDLDKMVQGDTFTLSVLNETYTYQVDQIRVVEPTDLTELQIVPGKDYCTLVTCTPYGINTHRLLVRGHRVANPQGDAKVVADAMQIDTMYVIPFVGVPILLLLVLMMLMTTGRNARHRDSYAEVSDWERELERRSREERERKRGENETEE